jgi:N-acetylmuramoyl-L-alanine amidase CwlA
VTLEQAFQQLNIIQDFIPRSNSNRPGRPLTATHVTIHNTGNPNPGADAAAHARYVKGADAQRRQVSWHYTVDDRVIYQSLPVNEIGWHAGRGNSKSIGIEICMHRGMDEAAAYDRAALLVAVFALQNNIPLRGRIVQHRHWTPKNCPVVLRSKDGGWEWFLAKVSAAHASLRSPAPMTLAASRKMALVQHRHDDDCDLLNSAAPIGAARGRVKGRKAVAARKKAKSKARKRR